MERVKAIEPSCLFSRTLASTPLELPLPLDAISAAMAVERGGELDWVPRFEPLLTE